MIGATVPNRAASEPSKDVLRGRLRIGQETSEELRRRENSIFAECFWVDIRSRITQNICMARFRARWEADLAPVARKWASQMKCPGKLLPNARGMSTRHIRGREFRVSSDLEPMCMRMWKMVLAMQSSEITLQHPNSLRFLLTLQICRKAFSAKYCRCVVEVAFVNQGS